MKIYCSGASAEADRVADWMAKLRAAGFEITCDWVAGLKANLAAGKTDALLTDEDRVHYACLDLDGIDRADIFWLLCPNAQNRSTGCWLEIGYAISMQAGLNIIVSGPGRKRCIFVALADHQFETDKRAFSFILSVTEDA